MGISTPKPPFNLAEFLAEKAPPRAKARPTWSRRFPRAEVESPAADPTEE